MAVSLPQFEVNRFASIDPAIVVHAYLLKSKSTTSLKSLQSKMKPLAPPEPLDRAIKQLIAQGHASLQGDKLELTTSGKASARAVLGGDVNKPWTYIRDRRLSILALGLDANDAETRRKLAKPNTLRAAIIAVACGLPKDLTLMPASVRSELVWRVLRSAIPEIIGRGPFPVIDKSNPVDCSILAGLAGVPAKRIDKVLAALAARAVGAPKAEVDVLRKRLVQLALSRVAPATGVAVEPRGLDDFGERVKTVARTLNTPPFQGRVAIAQIYDEYGRHHPDAGSLANFKERLITAARARKLDLSRLDLPEHMDRDLRERSHTPWDSGAVHFVVTRTE
jgi:hypothetical protein